MAIIASDWLITSDVAHEAAFRIDVPEPHRGKWVLSYLPTALRLTREQAIAGVVLAEMILIGLLRPDGEFDNEIASLHAGVLGLTITDAMCLLALRTSGQESDSLRPNRSRPDSGESGGAARFCHHTTSRNEVSR
ncbi:hypothetical protein HLB23_34015 [Nocardia uniformis]|uniref:Uncharacterized protein n=1 Tax=Nocardia uniformis TaxID=53432 RepID=A0A849CE24_9NOCA|nr:hypothetical protein [Nocardia uniformis]NNH74810.1 hypothetical protein [Nocardia uniformis]